MDEEEEAQWERVIRSAPPGLQPFLQMIREKLQSLEEALEEIQKDKTNGKR
jgi:hypothetical protein